MKDKIKEKLLKGCGIKDEDLFPNRTYNGFQVRKMLSKAIEETSKEKDKEFIKILDERIDFLEKN